MFSFGVKKPTAEEAAAQKKAMTKEFSASLRKQIREIDREIRSECGGCREGAAQRAARTFRERRDDAHSPTLLLRNVLHSLPQITSGTEKNPKRKWRQP
jgi:hypothetical protein